MKTKHSAIIYQLSLVAVILLAQFFAYSGQVSAQANVSSFTLYADGGNTTVSTITIPVTTQPSTTSGSMQTIPVASTPSASASQSDTLSVGLGTGSATATGTQTSSSYVLNWGSATYGDGVIYINPSQTNATTNNSVVSNSTSSTPAVNSPVNNNNTSTTGSATVNNNASAVSSNSSGTASNPVAVINTPANVPVQAESVATQQQVESQPVKKSDLPVTTSFALSAPAAEIKVNAISVPATVAPKISTIAINAKEATHVSTLKELQSLKSWQTWKDPNTKKVYKIQAKTVAAANTIKAKLNKAVKTLNAPKTAVPKKAKK